MPKQNFNSTISLRQGH